MLIPEVLQIMDADEPGPQKQTEALQDLWQAADIGRWWIDLRPLQGLTSCSIHGLPCVWLPPNLQKLDVDTWG